MLNESSKRSLEMRLSRRIAELEKEGYSHEEAVNKTCNEFTEKLVGTAYKTIFSKEDK